jgi:hypothetical protein
MLTEEVRKLPDQVSGVKEDLPQKAQRHQGSQRIIESLLSP